MLVSFKQTESNAVFNVWSMILVMFAVFSFAYFGVMAEFLLKRRACTSFELIEKMGFSLIAFYMILIAIASISEWING